MQIADGAQTHIQIKLYFFSIVADLVGKREAQCTLPRGSKVGDLVERLAEEHTSLRAFIRATDSHAGRPLRLVRQGRMILDMDAPLADGDEIRIFPIISGG